MDSLGNLAPEFGSLFTVNKGLLIQKPRERLISFPRFRFKYFNATSVFNIPEDLLEHWIWYLAFGAANTPCAGRR